MGSYIYDNYIARYVATEGTIFNDYPYRYEKEDIINIVCLLNQKTPVVYDNRYACQDGDYMWFNSFCEQMAGATQVVSFKEGKCECFPYSLFFKEGRPERELLEELETGFDYISNNKVTDEEIYEWWGKTLYLASNYEESLKDWNGFNLLIFYNYIRQELNQFMTFNHSFNDLGYEIPAKYVFDNDKEQKLDIFDAFQYFEEINRKTYSFLTDEEFNLYAGCMNRIVESYIYWCDNETNNIIRQKEKDGN